MGRPQVIEPKTARAHSQDGATIVCAYDDEQKCAKVNLADSISLPQLKQRQDDLPRDQELIFYCN